MTRPASITLLLGLAAVISFGCATTQDLAVEDRERTKTVRIASEIHEGAVMCMDRTDATVGVLFGVVGGLAAAARDQEGKIRDCAQRAEIDIGDMVASEFRDQLQAREIFSIVDSMDADAILRIDVPYYGLFVPHGFASKLKPVLMVHARLERPDGTVIWEDNENVSASADETPSHSFDDYMSDPERLRDAWQQAAQIVVAEMLERM